MRSRWLGLLTGFCALCLVLPSCLTRGVVWRDAAPRELEQRCRAEPSGAWFSPEAADALVIELPPHVVDQIATATDFLPGDAVGMVLTSPNLQARLCNQGPLSSPLLVPVAREPLMVFLDEDAEGRLRINAGGPWPSPELRALHVLPPRGEPFDREMRLHFCQTTTTNGSNWLRVVVTPFTVAIDIVTFPVQLLLFLLFSRGC